MCVAGVSDIDCRSSLAKPWGFLLVRKVSGWLLRGEEEHVSPCMSQFPFVFCHFLPNFFVLFLLRNPSSSTIPTLQHFLPPDTSSSTSEIHFLSFVHLTDALVWFEIYWLCTSGSKKMLHVSMNFNFILFLWISALKYNYYHPVNCVVHKPIAVISLMRGVILCTLWF